MKELSRPTATLREAERRLHQRFRSEQRQRRNLEGQGLQSRNICRRGSRLPRQCCRQI